MEINDLKWDFTSGAQECEIDDKIELVIDGFEVKAEINATCDIQHREATYFNPPETYQRNLDVNINDFHVYDENGLEVIQSDDEQDKFAEEIKYQIKQHLTIL